jgi:hypothetical protein
MTRLDDADIQRIAARRLALPNPTRVAQANRYHYPSTRFPLFLRPVYDLDDSMQLDTPQRQRQCHAS